MRKSIEKKAPIAQLHLEKRDRSQCVCTYVMGQRANNPAARYAFTTDEMPPCVSNDVPSITTRRGFRARISGFRRRAEVAADVEVLDQQPRLAARRAGDVFHLHDVHVAAALHLRGDGASDA